MEILLKVMWTMFVVCGASTVIVYFSTHCCGGKKQDLYEAATVILMLVALLSFMSAVILGIWGVSL